MNTSSDARNPVEPLAEEFLIRKRRGEQPNLREYVERHPELAGEYRQPFPVLLMMENLGGIFGAKTGSLAADNGAAVGIRLERLGDYRILREMGGGGMGVVYEAEQESLGRRVRLWDVATGSQVAIAAVPTTADCGSLAHNRIFGACIMLVRGSSGAPSVTVGVWIGRNLSGLNAFPSVRPTPLR